jgi:hypothetical protein
LKGKAPYIASQHVGYGILDVNVINNAKTLDSKFYENVYRIVKDQFTITKPSDTIITTNDINNINSHRNVAQNIVLIESYRRKEKYENFL